MLEPLHTPSRRIRAPRRALRAMLAFACVALVFVLGGLAGCGSTSTTPSTAAPQAARSSSPAAPREAPEHSGRGFRSRALLDEHFQKHGREFGDVTEDEYLRIAQELRDRPAGGDVPELVRGDGVVSRFDRHTGTFIAFNSNGVIRTCFRPNDGERYFRRQALAHGGNR
jgi:hypothetical protein